MNTSSRVFALLTTASLLCALPACKKELPPTQEITKVREATEQEKKVESMPTKERMHMSQMPAGHGATPAAAPQSGDGDAPTAADFRWTVPAAWEELPATPMRLANLRLKENPEVEMYFTVMPGDGGGLLANVNRWYGQMGLEPITQEQLDALPFRMMLFKPAVYVSLHGAFKGMGTEAKENYALYGLALVADGHAAFLKMTGPAEIVDQKTQDFVVFSQSIVPAEIDSSQMQLKAVPGEDGAAPAAAPEAAAPAGASAPAMPAPAASAAPAASGGGVTVGTGGELPATDALKWDVPEGWQVAEQRPMRVVTLNVGASECYISVLGGQAGGVEANINRWCGQLGNEPLSAEAIEALEKVDVLGAPCALVKLEGDYQGMGGPVQTGYGLLGVVRATEAQSLFVKMVGPKDEIAAQADNFRAFVRSLR